MTTRGRFDVLSFSVIAKVLTLWLLSLMPASANGADSVVFPADSGYVSIKEKYGAKGDGKTDDTAAFQKAMMDGVRNLYLPAGTYLISDSIVMGGKRCHWQGENEATTVLKLQDSAAGFDDVERPKPFVSTFAAFRDPKAAMGQAFRNSLFNLTIDVGAGNPGAVGLHYLNNNQGTVRDITIRSSDLQRVGKAGLALVTNWPGPAYIHRVTIHGFDIGLWSENSQYSFVCEHLRLSDQRVVGIENLAQTLSIRKLTSRNAVPVLRTRGNAAMVAMLDSELSGGDSGSCAIESLDNSALIVERLKTDGYGTAIRSTVSGETREIKEPVVASFLSHPVLPLKTKADVAPVTTVEETPTMPLPPPSEWASVVDFGAKRIDGKQVPEASDAIQKAIDSGKKVVYFPFGAYAIQTPIRVRANVERIIGMESTLRLLRNGGAISSQFWIQARSASECVSSEQA